MEICYYAATHPNAVVRYQASGMLLTVESDCSYLSETQARSLWAGFHFLGEENTETLSSYPNGPIHVPCQILKEIVSSAAEGELAAVFHNAKKPALSACALKSSVMLSPRLLSSRTTQRHQASPTTRENNADPRQLTCASTGYEIASNRNNFGSFGDRANSTEPTNSQNITPQHITETYAPHTLRPNGMHPKLLSSSTEHHLHKLPFARGICSLLFHSDKFLPTCLMVRVF